MKENNSKNSYQKLNQEITAGLLFYTSNLETLRKFEAMQEKVKESLIELDIPLEDFDFEELNWITKINVLLTISILDLVVSTKGLSNASDIQWEKIFFVKHSYLTIHETIDKYDKLHNKKISKLADSKYPLIKNKLDAFQKELRIFRREHGEKIRHIRNKAGGHIDADFKTYYDV